MCLRIKFCMLRNALKGSRLPPSPSREGGTAHGRIQKRRRRRREVKVHNGMDVSSDKVEKLLCLCSLISGNLGMTSEAHSTYSEEEDGDEEAMAYYDDDDLDAFADEDLDCSCEEGVLGLSDPFGGEVKPRILLMGLRRSGKSSIQKIWDFPGQIDFFDPTFDYEMIFRGTGALIFVIDSQDDYVEALSRLHLTVTRAYKVNPNINFEVFIHKVDGLSDDHKIEKQRDIHKRANDDLADAALERIHLSFYLTSIYDHSIFEAFSKVVQKLIPQLPTLENLLNIFISNSGIEKAFLFDVVSKIYIATDSSPVDMQTYELCCDMIDVVIDISCIYGLTGEEAGIPYDKESMAIIRLNNTTVMYLKEVTKFLALVCFLREESFERKGLIDYNFHCFRKAIQEVFDVRVKVQKSRKLLSQRRWSKQAMPNGTPAPQH
uniref:Ras-related GTP-binding protein n=1 Tax=Paramormyrops kingsleyae TaxID=1676925 RepID=A0A3B3T8U7_9TELE